MPLTGIAGGAFATGDNAGNDDMSMAGRLTILGLGLELPCFLPLAESILRMRRLPQGGKLRCDGNLNKSYMYVIVM